MRVLIDMNLSPHWVQFLSVHDIDSDHWSKLGSADASDSTVLQYAAANGYVLFTHDLDFGAILAASGDRAPSVVQLRTDDVLPESCGAAVVSVLRQHAQILSEGALVTIDATRKRVRLLPLQSD